MEVQDLLAENGFSLDSNVTLEDLNQLYFAPLGRTLREDQLFKLEHFVVATN